MKPITLPKSLIDAVRPEDVRQYLLATGWNVNASFANRGVLLFDRPDAPQLVLPNDPTLGDYAARLVDLVTALSEFEHRSAWDILRSLAAPAADLFRLEFKSPDAERYAFIRDTLAHSEGAFEDIPPMWSFRHLPGRHPTFDAAIDAARSL